MTKKNFIYLIGFLLTITFIVTSFNVVHFFDGRASYQYSDWLINYQAGFIRRGLIGEFFFKISSFTKIRLDFLLLFFVITLYIIFYYNFFKIIKEIKLKLVDLFIILSPLSFFYTAFEQKASGRKDIIFLALLSLFIIIIKKLSPIKQIYVMILFTTITSLTHSGLIFYNIYFLVLFLCFNHNLDIKKNILLSSLFITSSLFILILISYNSTLSNTDLNILCESILQYLPNCGKSDYINTLTWGLDKNLAGNKLLWFDLKYFIFYFFAFIFCFGFLFYSSAKSNFYNINFLYILIICFILTLPLYYIGADYGRYLHVSYISSILIYYFLLNQGIIIRNNLSQKISKILLISLIFIYSFTWTVPHCCESNPKFNYRKLID